MSSCSVNDAVPVEVDHLGSGVLRGQASSSLTEVSPELCYLDVIDCPELVSLDLSGCQPNRHVTLRRCPALRSLRVTDRGSGALFITMLAMVSRRYTLPGWSITSMPAGARVSVLQAVSGRRGTGSGSYIEMEWSTRVRQIEA